MPLRAAAICGLLAPVTFVVGLLLGDLAQPDEFSPADDNISDVGAQTADHAWLYNQIAANLNGLLIVGLALGLWRALGPEGPPPITRHAVDLLCCDCTLRDDKARRELGYAPVIGVEEGLRALRDAHT